MIRLSLTCLIGLSVLAAPCVYDTDPREPSTIAAVIAKLFPANNQSQWPNIAEIVSNLRGVPAFADNAPAVRK